MSKAPHEAGSVPFGEWKEGDQLEIVGTRDILRELRRLDQEDYLGRNMTFIGGFPGEGMIVAKLEIRSDGHEPRFVEATVPNSWVRRVIDFPAESIVDILEEVPSYMEGVCRNRHISSWQPTKEHFGKSPVVKTGISTGEHTGLELVTLLTSRSTHHTFRCMVKLAKAPLLSESWPRGAIVRLVAEAEVLYVDEERKEVEIKLAAAPGALSISVPAKLLNLLRR